MVLVVGYVVVIPKRLKYFNRTEKRDGFLDQFRHEHQAAYGWDVKLAAGGFPDSGNGYYADKLQYKSWYELNGAIRAH